MFEKQSSQDKKAPGGAGQAPMVWEVLISRDDRVMVGGENFPVPAGESVHVAVLDLMHHLARSEGGPVEVLITDEQEEYTARIGVSPDGSSWLVQGPGDSPEPDAEPGLPNGQASSIEPRAAEPLFTKAPLPEPPPADTRADAETPAPVPEELAALVHDISRALDSGAQERAAALAFRLREHAKRHFGNEHPSRLEAYALEAFTAYRCGDYTSAMSICLELSQIRHRQGDHPRAHEELRRAVAACSRIDDLPSAVEHSRALLAWSRQGNGGAQDTELVSGINRRIHALIASAVTPGSK